MDSHSIKSLLAQGWHCSHFFYVLDRQILTGLDSTTREQGSEHFQRILDPTTDGNPSRLQTGIVSGHKADFSLMMMDPDPIKIESVHQSLLASPLGVAIVPTYSYVSISEVSEYAQSVQQYAEKLQRDGEDPASSAYQTKINVYTQRLEKMNYQRLTPDFVDWGPSQLFFTP